MKLSLCQRIIVPSSAVFVLLQIGLGAYALDRERHTLLRQLDSRAASLAHGGLASDLPDTQLGEELLSQDDVTFCEIQSGAGQVLFRGQTAEDKQSRSYSFTVAMPTTSTGHGELENERGFLQSETERRTVSLGLSTVENERILREARGTIIVAVLFSTAVAVFFLTLIARRAVGNSFTRLLNEVKITSAAYVDHQKAFPACDEVEQLAHALHAMSAQLREAVEKQDRFTAQTTRKPASFTRATSCRRG